MHQSFVLNRSGQPLHLYYLFPSTSDALTSLLVSSCVTYESHKSPLFAGI